MTERRTRREFLAATSGVGTAVVAGCSGDGGGGDSDGNETDTPEGTATKTQESDGTPTDGSGETTEPDDGQQEEDGDEQTGVDPWPLARYDLGNTGRNTDTTGPQEEPQIIWETTLDGDPATTPILSASTVYVCTTAGTLYALDPDTGNEQWRSDVGGPVATPALGPERVFVPNAGITAVDRGTGDERWTFEGSGVAGATPAVYRNGTVFAGLEEPGGSHDVYAVSATGFESWIQSDLTIGTGSGTPTAIAVDDGVLYVSTTAPGTLLLDERSGDRLGTIDLGPSSGLALDDEILASGGPDAGVYDRASEEVRGTLGDAAPSVTDATAPLLTDEYAVYGTETGVNASRKGAMGLDRDGTRLRWDYGQSTEMRHPPVGAAEKMYAPGEAVLYGIGRIGAGLWTRYFDDEVVTGPAVSSGRVYLGLANGRFVALAD